MQLSCVRWKDRFQIHSLKWTFARWTGWFVSTSRKTHLCVWDPPHAACNRGAADAQAADTAGPYKTEPTPWHTHTLHHNQQSEPAALFTPSNLGTTYCARKALIFPSRPPSSATNPTPHFPAFSLLRVLSVCASWHACAAPSACCSYRSHPLPCHQQHWLYVYLNKPGWITKLRAPTLPRIFDYITADLWHTAS